MFLSLVIQFDLFLQLILELIEFAIKMLFLCMRLIEEMLFLLKFLFEPINPTNILLTGEPELMTDPKDLLNLLMMFLSKLLHILLPLLLQPVNGLIQLLQLVLQLPNVSLFGLQLLIIDADHVALCRRDSFGQRLDLVVQGLDGLVVLQAYYTQLLAEVVDLQF